MIDYSLRLHKELGSDRTLWITAYANNVMSYIPSVRILKEGFYEGDDTSMVLYGMTTKWAWHRRKSWPKSTPWSERCRARQRSLRNSMASQCGMPMARIATTTRRTVLVQYRKTIMTPLCNRLFRLFQRLVILVAVVGNTPAVQAQPPKLEPIEVEGQPLAANVTRLLDALQFLGRTAAGSDDRRLATAARARDVQGIQKLLDSQVLLAVTINPESRVKVTRGPGPTTLQQFGYVPILMKIVNLGTVTKTLNITSPQSGPVYSRQSAWRMGKDGKYREDPNRANPSFQVQGDKDRFLQVEMFTGRR